MDLKLNQKNCRPGVYIPTYHCSTDYFLEKSYQKIFNGQKNDQLIYCI